MAQNLGDTSSPHLKVKIQTANNATILWQSGLVREQKVISIFNFTEMLFLTRKAHSFCFEFTERLECKNKPKELQHFICISDSLISAPLKWRFYNKMCKSSCEKNNTHGSTLCSPIFLTFCEVGDHKSVTLNLVQMFLNILMKQLCVVLHHTKNSSNICGRGN